MRRLAETARDAKDPARLPESAIPRPDYDAVAPSDWVGARAVRVMLDDLDFPRRVGEIRERAGNWRVPARSPYETVRLDRLLEPFDDRERFGSVDDAVRKIRRRNHGF